MGDTTNVRRGCRIAFRIVRVLPRRAQGAIREAIVLGMSGEAAAQWQSAGAGAGHRASLGRDWIGPVSIHRINATTKRLNNRYQDRLRGTQQQNVSHRTLVTQERQITSSILFSWNLPCHFLFITAL